MKLRNILAAGGLVIGTVGCEAPGPWTRQKDFSPYVEMFIQEAKLRGVDVDDSKLSIEFGTPQEGESYWGDCKWNNDSASVMVRSEAWVNADDDFRTVMVFHELGHCLLHQVHRAPDFTHYPNSIMLSNAIIGDQFNHYRTWYIDELFHGGDEGLDAGSPP